VGGIGRLRLRRGEALRLLARRKGVSALKGRLQRIEEAARGGACAECGLPSEGPNYTIDWGEALLENPDEECPRCGRRPWWVWEIDMPKAEGRVRAFVAESKQRDCEFLETNCALVGLPPLVPEQLAEYKLEETKWGGG